MNEWPETKRNCPQDLKILEFIEIYKFYRDLWKFTDLWSF